MFISPPLFFTLPRRRATDQNKNKEKCDGIICMYEYMLTTSYCMYDLLAFLLGIIYTKKKNDNGGEKVC